MVGCLNYSLERFSLMTSVANVLMDSVSRQKNRGTGELGYLKETITEDAEIGGMNKNDKRINWKRKCKPC
jgi:hypothetical protein